MQSVSARWLRILVLVVAGLGAGQALPADGKSDTEIEQDAPNTGSMLKRKVMRGGSLPVNKRYEQFSDDEKQLFHDRYERIEPGDEPPFPADGMRPLFDAIIKANQRLDARGVLYLVADVDAAGVVTNVSVESDTDQRMIEFAARALLVTRFKPAVCKGRPCKMQFPLAFEFLMGR